MIKNDNNMRKYPKVALVLGAGGAKGFSHIGSLEAFEKAGIKFDMIVGCSMGAIIGSCYSLGIPPKRMKEQALELSRGDIIDVRIPGKYGFVKGDKAEKVIRRFLEVKDVEPKFEDCKIPFACACTDIIRGVPVNLTKGELIPAVRASFSIGGIFFPVTIGNKKLWDGGILRRVPVDLARGMGADIVVAIDCIGPTLPIKDEEMNSYFETINRIFFMMDYEGSKDEIERADYIINTGKTDVNSIKMKNIDKAIIYGERTTKKHIPMIKQLIIDWIKNNN